MSTELFIEPHEVEIEDRRFIISKFPAMAGRKIVTQYFTKGLPKVGDYDANEEMMLAMMKYVARLDDNGNKIILATRALVDSHVVSKISSWEMLIKLEKKMLAYNCDFFTNGQILNIFETIAQSIPQWITKTLKDSLQQLSPQDTQPTEN